MMRTLVRLLLFLVVIVGIGGLLLGFWTRPARSPRNPADEPPGTTGTTDLDRAREVGAEVGERAAVAGTQIKEALGEAAITARIKAKMALDETVKARAIDVTTSGTTVTLNGTVDTQDERTRALRLARETEGVTLVMDRLVIRSPRAAPAPAPR